jgi:hypothetical protein
VEENRLPKKKLGKFALVMGRTKNDHARNGLQPREIAREFRQVPAKSLSPPGSKTPTEAFVPGCLAQHPIVVISS